MRHEFIKYLAIFCALWIGAVGGHYHGKAQVYQGLMGHMTQTMEALK